jgi:DNA-binding LacI/PurR family transcriptional regulator
LLDADGNNILTTIRVPLTAVGAAAVELLLECVTGTSGQLGTRVVPTQLVVRRSTAPARARISSPSIL